MKRNKLGISPVVATALFLVVTVVAAVGFQSWYSTFQSGFETKIENQDVLNELELLDLEQFSLFVKSEKAVNVSLLRISLNGVVQCSYTDGFVEQDLLFNIDMDLTNSSHVLDESGNGLHINISGNPTFPGSRLGKAIRFDGTGDYLRTENSSLMQTNVTATYWVKRNGNPAIFDSVFALGRGADNRYIMNGNLVGNFRFFDSLVNEGQLTNVGGTSFVNDTWFHIGIVFFTNGSKFGYIDGLRNLTDNDGRNLTQITDPEIHYGSSNQESSLLIGDMDELQYYNRSLSQAEVQNIYYFNSVELNLSSGVNEIPVLGCNLERGQSYEVLLSDGVSSIVSGTFLPS